MALTITDIMGCQDIITSINQDFHSRQ